MLIFSIGSKNHNLGSRADALHLARRFHAVHARQQQVQQYHIRNQFLHEEKGGLRAFGFSYHLQVGMHIQ